MRWLRHVFAPSVHRAFPPERLQRITRAIAEGERMHRGQVMFAIEPDLPLGALWKKVTPRQRAEHAFAVLKTWDTEANNGVLIYLLLADHAIEIVADRGLSARVTSAQWQQVCERMRARLRSGEQEAAVLEAVADVGALLVQHFPATPGAAEHNELPDAPQLLR
ncbi:MAG: TPM domain-containing protein [Stenotrophomonas sp.]